MVLEIRYGADMLWRRVVGEKYGSVWGGWCMNVVKGLYGFSFRKFISREWASFFAVPSV